MMRRGLAGLLLFVAAVLLAMAAGGWWMQRVVFDPAAGARVVDAAFGDDQLRVDVATAVGAATAERLGRPAEQLATGIEANFSLMLNDLQVREVLTNVVRHAQGHLVGRQDDPVQLTGQEMVFIVRDQHVFDVAPGVIPVDTIGWLSTVRSIVNLMVPVTAILGAIALVLGIVAHPTRDDLVFSAGVFCIVTAVLTFLLAYLVPAFVLPAVTSGAWTGIFPAIAEDQLGVVGGLSVVLAIAGCVLIFGSAGFRRRKAKGWSSPVRPRYSSDQRQWSR
jgi:hypothetical protein